MEGPEPSLWRALVFEPRRLVEVFVDFVLICGSFLVAYVLAVGGRGTDFERSVYLSALPILLGSRYVLFVALGVYRRVWRFATARDVVPIFLGCIGSRSRRSSSSSRFVRSARSRPVRSSSSTRSCTLWSERRAHLAPLPEARGRRGHRRRVLTAGAGRAGRGLARGLREGREARVVGFLTTTHACAGVGSSESASSEASIETDRAIASTRAEEVLVTIPAAPQDRLDSVVNASEAAGIPCRIVRRHVRFSAPAPVEAARP
jgi:FlaA1/EpsC-like NDP-sugar epimerase